jgi:DNA-binding XRE family transcriptional regulator
VPNFSKVFQDEIRRLARKETKSDMERLRAENAELRRQIGQIRKHLSMVERVSKRTAKATEKVAAKVTEPSNEDESTVRPRISAKTIRQLRERLGLTQAEMGKLLGVSGQSIYQWERQEGRLNLRRRTALAVHGMKGIGSREARRRLNEMAA